MSATLKLTGVGYFGAKFRGVLFGEIRDVGVCRERTPQAN